MYQKKFKKIKPVKSVVKNVKPDNEPDSFIFIPEDEVIEEEIVFVSDIKEEDIINIDKVREYWTEETENAVIQFLYLNETFFDARIKEEHELARKKKKLIDIAYCKEMERRKAEVMQIKNRVKLRNKIFKKSIEKPLNRLIENIIFNFKLFRQDVDVKTAHNDCGGFVYSKFVNYNPWRNTKSFSFYGTIAKHYLLGERKDLDKILKTNIDYEITRDEADSKEVVYSGQESELEKSMKLFIFISEEVQKEITNGDLSKNDIKVGDAILQIFRNHEKIKTYHKNQLYQIIKEVTGLETKDVTYSLHRFKVLYKFLKQNFIRNSEED